MKVCIEYFDSASALGIQQADLHRLLLFWHFANDLDLWRHQISDFRLSVLHTQMPFESLIHLLLPRLKLLFALKEREEIRARRLISWGLSSSTLFRVIAA